MASDVEVEFVKIKVFVVDKTCHEPMAAPLKLVNALLSVVSLTLHPAPTPVVVGRCQFGGLSAPNAAVVPSLVNDM